MPVLCENSRPRASTMLLENYRYAQRQMKIVGGYVGKGSGECKAVVQWSAAGVLCRDTGLRSTTRKTQTYTLGSQRLNSTCSRAPCCASWKSEPCVI
jgi:hypothetical protein